MLLSRLALLLVISSALASVGIADSCRGKYEKRAHKYESQAGGVTMATTFLLPMSIMGMALGQPELIVLPMAGAAGSAYLLEKADQAREAGAILTQALEGPGAELQALLTQVRKDNPAMTLEDLVEWIREADGSREFCKDGLRTLGDIRRWALALQGRPLVKCP